VTLLDEEVSHGDHVRDRTPARSRGETLRVPRE
jgi:hypothetical protein